MPEIDPPDKNPPRPTSSRLWISLNHLHVRYQSREPERKMSIVPVSDQGIISNTPLSSEVWGPFQNFLEEFPLSIDLWGPFSDFPSLSRGIFPTRQTQINWSETPRAHLFKAYFPGLTGDQVIVFVDEDRMLQISTDDGKFTSRFKLPANAITDQVKASMNYGLLTVTVSKEMSLQPQNVRVVEITGSD